MRRSFFLQGLRTDWTRVRAFGEIELLRRASTVMLVFVPLMAALWPGVRGVLNRVSGVTFAVGPLPDLWVLAFFAALSAVVGRTVYETSAPELIRETSEDALVASRRREHAETRSRGLVTQAYGDIRTAVETLPYPTDTSDLTGLIDLFAFSGSDQVGEELVRRAEFAINYQETRDLTTVERQQESREDWDASYALQFWRWTSELRGYPEWSVEGRLLRLLRSALRVAEAPGNLRAGAEGDLTQDAIEIGARLEYLEASRRRPVRSLFALVSFLFAVAIILWITGTQSIAVLRAAEWWFGR